MRGLSSEHFPTPEKQSQQPPQPPPPPRYGYNRCLICPTCNAACILLISRSKKNPNRPYYICRAHDPIYFKWVDDVNPKEFIDVPYCGGCNAGVCRVRKVKVGPDAVRVLFMCAIEEGEGSCGYRVWQDEHEMEVREANERMVSSPSIATNCGESSSNAGYADGNTQKSEVADNESPAINTSQHPQYVVSSPLTTTNCGESSANADLGKENTQKGEAADNESPAVNTSHLQCVVSPPSTATNYGESSSNGCMVPNISLVNSDSISMVTRNLLEVGSSSEPLVHMADLMADTKLFQVAQDVPLNTNHLSVTRIHNVMTDSISTAFGQAAVDVLNKLVTLLETMGAQDHEAMSQAAETTFVALNCLTFDHQDLKEHIKKLIHCARTLSEMEHSMQRNDSYRKLLDRCSNERMKLDEINRIHAETVQTVASSKNHLKVMQENISSVRSWLVNVEIQLSLYEFEMQNMEFESCKIFQIKENLERNYVIAVKELEELEGLREHKKTEHDAAKAAFERQRALLREYRCLK